MIPLLDAAREVLIWAEKRGYPFCLIGGLALQRWGEQRQTADVDLTLLCEIGSEDAMIGEILSSFAPRRPDMRQFALQNRVVLLSAANGVEIDLSLGAFDFEVEAVHRATPFEFAPGYIFPTCSAEDLIVYKMFASRYQDLADVQSVVARQGGNLDLPRIRKWLKTLGELKEDPALADRFDELLRKSL